VEDVALRVLDDLRAELGIGLDDRHDRELTAAREPHWLTYRADTPCVDELAVVEVVRTEPEAELLCSLLRSAGIECMHRVTNYGAGAFEGLPIGGPREIVTRARDVASAREVLQQQNPPR